MKKLMLLIIPTLLFLFIGNINVKADSDSDGWYTPDLQNYTFNIPAYSEDVIFRIHHYDTGNYKASVRLTDNFGVSQTSTGALNFEAIEDRLNYVAIASLLAGRAGVTPMIYNLPSYISWNIFNTYYPDEYKGAVNIHVITYRLDFLDNYSMLLDDYIYDIVYSLEVMYELNINYDSNDYIISRGYTIHWYDITDNEEYELYTPFDEDDNLLLFQLKKLGGQENGGYEQGYQDGYDEGYDKGLLEGDYQEGYQEGYQDGFIAGEKSKIAKNNESFYNNIAIWIPAVITLVALASIISYLGLKKKE